MYIAIFAGEDREYVLKLKTLSDVLNRTLEIVDAQGLEESRKIYDNREAFIEDIGEFMQDSDNGYIIGVDVDKDTFEIIHAKYDWVVDLVDPKIAGEV